MDQKLNNLPFILWGNMKRSIDRYEYMISHLNDLNIINHTRIENIDAKLYDISNTNIKKVEKGQIFCGASHLKALLFYVNNSNEIGNTCLICEDDISFNSMEFWNKSFNEYLDNPCVAIYN